MVLISRENRRKIYEYLLNEGVLVLKKDFSNTPHNDTQVPNLQVWMVMRSLHSKGIVELVFNWLYYYYYVKTEGVKFLRDNLGIAEENIVPLTFKKTNRNFETREDREGGEDRPRGRGRGGRGRGGRGGERGSRRGGGRGGFGRGGRHEGEGAEHQEGGPEVQEVQAVAEGAEYQE